MDIDPKELPLGFLLNTLGSAILDETKARLEDSPVEVIELGILWLIDLAPGHRQGEYARFQHRDVTTFGRYVDRLESKGFIRRKAVSGDRRAWALHLTRSGNAVLADGKQQSRSVERRLTRSTDTEVAQVKRFLLAQLKRIDGG
jgi:DNA-binding MarR family transcriptional regulator